MKITKLSQAVAAAFAARSANVFDISYLGRMGAGFPGDVDRHTAIVEPVQNSVATPCTVYGQAAIIDAAGTGVRPFTAGDTAVTKPYCAIVRPYPTQAPAGSSNAQQGVGSAAVPAGMLGGCRQGYIAVQLNTGVAAPVKGGAVFIWCAATVGNHIQGGYETQASGGNTAALDARYTYNGPADANGVTEISWNL